MKYFEFKQSRYTWARTTSKKPCCRQLLDAMKSTNNKSLEARLPSTRRPTNCSFWRERLKQILFHGLNAFQEAHEVKRFGHVFIGSQLENFVAISFRSPGRDDDDIGATALSLLA